MTVSEWCAVAVVALNVAQVVWMQRRIRRNEREAVTRRQGEAWRRKPGGWIQLESGWSFPVGEDTAAFVIVMDDGTAYWWLKRRERTLVEGPAPTLEAARAEVVQARRTFL